MLRCFPAKRHEMTRFGPPKNAVNRNGESYLVSCHLVPTRIGCPTAITQGDCGTVWLSAVVEPNDLNPPGRALKGPRPTPRLGPTWSLFTRIASGHFHRTE